MAWPEDDLTLSESIAQGSHDAGDSYQSTPIVVAFDASLPATPADGCILEKGGSANLLHIGLRDTGTVLRLKVGDGRVETPDDDVVHLDISGGDLPSDTATHTFVFEADPGNGTVRAWIDGAEVGTQTGTGMRGGKNYNGATGFFVSGGTSDASGEPTNAWPGGAVGNARFYGNQLVTTSPPSGGTNLTGSGLVATATIGTGTVTQTHELVGQGLIGSSTIGTGSLAPGLVGQGLAATAETGIGQLTQIHQLTGQGLGASATVGAGNLLAGATLAGQGLAAAGSIGAGALTQVHELTGAGLTGTSSIGLGAFLAEITYEGVRIDGRAFPCAMSGLANKAVLTGRANAVRL